MAQINFTEIDFDELKQAIIDYITNTSDFEDQNQEGSNFNLLCGLLAYVTNILSYNLNQALNETYITTVELRSNLLKIIKLLNYVPYRKLSSRIKVDLEITELSNIIGATSQYLLKYDQISSGGYNFYYTGENIELVQQNTEGNYTLNGVTFYEGELIEILDSFVGDNTEFQEYIIEDDDVGQYLKVFTIDPVTSVRTEWELYDEGSVYDLPGSEYIYFLEEIEEGYKIFFGNNKLGRIPEEGEIIGFEYIRPSGAEANELVTYSWAGDGITTNINDGFNQNYILASNITINQDADNIQKSYAGAPRESVEEIKFNAPKFYTSQARAVTENDYASLAIKHEWVEKANVIGGEKILKDDGSDDYELGKVFINAKTDTSVYPFILFTATDLNTIREYLLGFSVVTINPIVRNAQYIYLDNESILRYTSDKIPSVVDTATSISTYVNSTQASFGEYFEYSKYLTNIDDADPLTTSNITKLEKYIIMYDTEAIVPNTYEIYENEQRTGVYVTKFAKFIKKTKLEDRERVPAEWFGVNGTPDEDGLYENPYFGQVIPSTRIEEYRTGAEFDNTLVNVYFPSNHPYNSGGDVSTPGFYEVLYADVDENGLPVYIDDTQTDVNWDEQGGSGESGDLKLYFGNEDDTGKITLDFSSITTLDDQLNIVALVKAKSNDIGTTYFNDIWLVAGAEINTGVIDELLDETGNTYRVYYGETVISELENVGSTGEEFYAAFTDANNAGGDRMFKIISHSNEPFVETDATAQQSRINVRADVDGNLGSKYFTISSLDATFTEIKYWVWFNTSTGDFSTPTAEYTEVEIVIPENATKAQVATAIDNAFTVHAADVNVYFETGETEKLIFESITAGVVTDANMNDTDFTYEILTLGAPAEVKNSYSFEIEHVNHEDGITPIIYDRSLSGTIDDDFATLTKGDPFVVYYGSRELSEPIYDVYGNLIEGSDLNDNEIINVEGINSDFEGAYRLRASSSVSVENEWLKTDRLRSDSYPTGYGKEMPDYTALSYTTELEMPGTLKAEPNVEYRFYFETQDDDLFLNSSQILTILDDDITIDTEKAT
jgi:hypothetical protein